MNITETLECLCTQAGPSGFIGAVAEKAAELLKPYMDEVSVDRLGNVIGVRRCGIPNAKKLLLDAHLDEVGLLVIGIEQGFLRFRTIGGIDPRILPNREVTVMTTPPRLGIIACLPPHVQSSSDQEKSEPAEHLYIDVGLTQDRAEQEISIGTPIVFREPFFQLNETQLCGKAMDDRACFAVLLMAAERLMQRQLDVDLYIMGSNFEETGAQGATVGTYAVHPDFCVAVDVSHGKTPDSPKDGVFGLGEGVPIGIGPNMTRWMTERMIAKAREHAIPFQMEVMSGSSGTNGTVMQISREGVATSVLGLPLKYMHSPLEVVDIRDMEAAAALIAAFTEQLGREAEER